MIYNHSEEADIKILLKGSYTLYQGHYNKIKELEIKASIKPYTFATHTIATTGVSDSDTTKWS